MPFFVAGRDRAKQLKFPTNWLLSAGRHVICQLMVRNFIVSPSRVETKMLQWTEKFETGHSVNDSQHQMLISYVNRLEYLSRTANPTPQEAMFCDELIGFLDRYINEHFAQEERCTEHFKCPLKHENRKDLWFPASSDALASALIPTDSGLIFIEGASRHTCYKWIQHILQVDMALQMPEPARFRQASHPEHIFHRPHIQPSAQF